jgi:hypothetical protein
VNALTVTAINPSPVTGTKSFAPGGGAVTARIATLSAGGSATVTFRGTVN